MKLSKIVVLIMAFSCAQVFGGGANAVLEYKRIAGTDSPIGKVLMYAKVVVNVHLDSGQGLLMLDIESSEINPLYGNIEPPPPAYGAIVVSFDGESYKVDDVKANSDDPAEVASLNSLVRELVYFVPMIVMYLNDDSGNYDNLISGLENKQGGLPGVPVNSFEITRSQLKLSSLDSNFNEGLWTALDDLSSFFVNNITEGFSSLSEYVLTVKRGMNP